MGKIIVLILMISINGFSFDFKEKLDSLEVKIIQSLEKAIEISIVKYKNTSQFIKTQKDFLVKFTNDLYFRDAVIQYAIGEKFKNLFFKGHELSIKPGAEQMPSWFYLIAEYSPELADTIQNRSYVTQEMLKDFKLFEDPTYYARANSIISQIAPYIENPYLRGLFRIYIIDTNKDQAMAFGGGVIFVTKGVMDHLSDDELAGVLAHEMAHTEKGHLVQNLKFWATSPVENTGEWIKMKWEGHLTHRDEKEYKDKLKISFGKLFLNDIESYSEVAQNQELEADLRAKELISQCGCYEVNGIEAALTKLILRNEILNTGSIRKYPNIYERAGIAKAGDMLHEVDKNELVNLINDLKTLNLPSQIVEQSIPYISKIQIQNNFEIDYSIIPDSKKQFHLILGAQYFDLKNKALIKWSELQDVSKGPLIALFTQIYFDNVVNQIKNYSIKQSEISEKIFNQKLPKSEKESLLNSLIITYIEKIIPIYYRALVKLNSLPSYSVPDFFIGKKRIETYNRVATGPYEIYGINSSLQMQTSSEIREFISEYFLENKIKGSFEEDFQSPQIP